MPEELLNNHYIIEEQPYVLYNKVKAHCKGQLPYYLIGFCIIYFILNWIPELLGMFFTTSYVDVLSDFTPIDEAVREQLPSTPAVIYLYAFIVDGVLSLGEALYTLTFIRNRKTEYSAIFEGFSYFGKAFLLFIVKTLIVFMWSMLFFIPGILAALNFAQVFYIFADNPEKGVLQILAESKIRMYGNRMNYFKFFLYYVPFIFAAYMPVAAIAWFTDINTGAFPGIILLMICEIPMYCAMAYLEAGKAAFYELLINEGYDNFRYSGQDAFRDNNIGYF